MIVPILKFRAHVSAPLDYNEEKVEKGVASVFFVKNLPNDSKYAIYTAMKRLESNPAVSRKTRNRAFHMAINPGIDDRITENEVRALIEEMMDKLGYSSQPYVVYKHNDIEREHFHVVSSRIQPNGRIIRDCHIGYKVKSLLENLGPKYHFCLGLPEEKKHTNRRALGALSTATLPRMQPSGTDKKKMMEEIFELALSFPYTSLDQLSRLLREMNVGIRIVPSKDGSTNSVFLQALDSNGKGASRWLSANNTEGWAYKSYTGHLQRNIFNKDGFKNERIRLGEIVSFCYGKAESFADFAGMLRSAGIHITLSKDKNGELSPNGVLFIDPRVRGLSTLRELDGYIPARDLKKQLSDKEWMSAPARRTLTKEDKEIIKANIRKNISKPEKKKTNQLQTGGGLKM